MPHLIRNRKCAQPTGRLPHHAAFSIIELLVCIVVLSILLALALPMLASARRTAAEARTQSDLRQASSILHLYTAVYADTFPYFHTPGNPTTPANIRGTPLTGISYFSAGRSFWPNVLDDDVRRELIPILNKDREGAERVNRVDGFPIEWLRSSIHLTHTVFADPAYFSADEPPPDPSHFRATRSDEVMFPSHKGLLVSRAFRSRNLQGVPPQMVQGCVAFADGHTQWLDWAWPDDAIVSRPYGADVAPWLVLSTRHGLRGRDLP